ncbi:MAG: hypothetical protein HY562_12070 [Ignavibacteriales bacterium]|nr:hypothetical protein [Ignavibacteriales bacterium]
MSKRLLLKLGGASLVLALLVSGCQNSLNGPEVDLTDAEKQEIIQSIESDPLFTSDRNSLDDDGAGMTMGKTETPIYPRAWGRRITEVTRDVTFEQLNDTTVLATITTTISGTVIIRAKYSLSDTLLTTITKPFTEVLTRKAKFYKNPLAVGRRWLHREVSAVKGGTDGSLVIINQVRAIVGTDTLTIDNPLNYFLKLGKFGGREVPELPSSFLQNITVQVTVTSADPDTDIVTLHRPYFAMMAGMFRPLSVRMTMISQTQNGSSYTRVYEKSWTGVVIGRHHVFVGALTKSSIFDDVAAFSSQLWGIPYIVN